MRLDEAALVRWGASIGRSIDAPAFVGLSGPLGAGKSVLARSIGAGAGVTEPMPSPTFTLLQRYDVGDGRHIVHMDLYRIESPEELWELGWAQLPDEGDVVLVEWPERAGDLLPSDRWDVEITPVEGDPESRDVAVTRVGRPPALAGFPLSMAME